MTSLKQISLEEVAKHDKVEDCWLVIDNLVYDVTKFISLHPGGKNVMKNYLGKDATPIFNYFHDGSVKNKYKNLVIGVIDKPIKKKQSPMKQIPNTYGELVLMGDPNYVQGWFSPFYDDSHRKLRENLRKYIDEHLAPHAEKWDEQGSIPMEVIKQCAQQGFLALTVGYPWPEKWYPKKEVCGVQIDKPDSFHELVLYDELNRTGCAGLHWGIVVGTCIGLPPIIKFGNQELQDRIVGPCLRGEKLICLAITEPHAGSDVAGIQTTAELSECKQFYIVNGQKKWITNGIFCDYFTTAVRTGGKGMKGISMLLIEKTMPGVSTRKMKMGGIWSSGTTFITFENVKVPVNNLIGKEGNGFKQIVINFNHERLYFAMQSTRLARVCYEEAMKFAHKRTTFGKKLIEHPVIRNKLANMARQVESTHAILEQCCYNYDRMPQEQNDKQLGGAIALLKVQTTMVLEFCAREAVQIFGGLGYTRGGQGGKVERIYRDVRGLAIPGGSEEILLDLGIRQASKMMPQL